MQKYEILQNKKNNLPPICTLCYNFYKIKAQST
jgi:hypothetical protein